MLFTTGHFYKLNVPLKGISDFTVDSPNFGHFFVQKYLCIRGKLERMTRMYWEWCTYVHIGWNFPKIVFRMVWNKRIGSKFLLKLINVWYGIRACWLEKFVKINKRTPTLIRYSRVLWTSGSNLEHCD